MPFESRVCYCELRGAARDCRRSRRERCPRSGHKVRIVTHGHDNALYLRGREAMSRSDFAAAISLFEQSARLRPHHKTLELLGECRMHVGDHIGAIVPLAASTTLNRGVRSPSLLAEAFATLGCYGDARAMAVEALSRDPNNRRAAAVLEALPEDAGDALQAPGPILYGIVEASMSSRELAELIECDEFAEVYLGKSPTFDGVHVDLGAGVEITLENEGGQFRVGGDADTPERLSKAAAALTASLSEAHIRHYFSVSYSESEVDVSRSHYNWPDEEDADNPGVERTSSD